MKNNERNSRKRLNSLILLVAFTAVMLIVSTYAWFSNQRNVTISGLKGEVETAEGLQISLDAQHWVNTINFSDFETTANGDWKVKDSATTSYLNSGGTFKTPRGAGQGITNVIPTELLPVSTTGYANNGEAGEALVSDGIGAKGVKFYRGTNTETIKLMGDVKDITDVTDESGEDSSDGFIAFDLFVMNTAEEAGNDVLQIDPISDVIGTNEATGVQNTARVGFALYNNAGADMAIAGSNDKADTPEEIIAGTSTNKTILDFAVWEPNANQHALDAINTVGKVIKFSAADKTTYGLTSSFTSTQKLPTYALTYETVDETKTIDDILISNVYDWTVGDSGATPAKGVKKQYTLQTDGYASKVFADEASQRSTSQALLSSKALAAGQTTNTEFKIVANQYQKIRVYIWMEGQDPDCITSASLGGGLEVNIGLSKGERAE